MQLDKNQINNLCTGVKLAAELDSGSPDLRKFITVQGYSYSSDGKVINLKKFLNSNTLENIYFELRCYELSSDYFVNDWDVTEDDLL